MKKRLVELLGPDRPIYYCDAGTKNNGKFGHQQTLIVVTDMTGKVLLMQNIGDKTNNEGELIAITLAVGLAKKGSLILSDSELAVKLIAGRDGTKIERLKPLIRDAVSAIRKKSAVVRWIPRESNLAGHYIEQ